MRPRELVEYALNLLLAKNMSAFAGLWAEDGVLEFPFAQPGYPSRLDGRAAIHEYLRDYPAIVDIRAITRQQVHETTDPDVVIAEFAVDGVAVRTGRPYRLSYIAVVTVRDNEIRHYRDYWSPLAAAEALGGTDELMAAFASGGSDA
ncbi:nuclear transport factor 2 family protein [Amycolatopsis sp. NPDC059021]|uniref:nuclear transport factor 2 family protein n=1 Tax=Amycolatopsis sp. NPDC059021 TaxID=3346704 RepID=UPI00366A79FA